MPEKIEELIKEIEQMAKELHYAWPVPELKRDWKNLLEPVCE